MRSLLRKTSANSLLMVLLLTVMAVGTVGAAPAIVILHATQDIILADGKAQVTIWAEVHDSNGRPINGATVEFQTTAGTLSQTRSSAFNGRAETRLTSGVQPGVAHITAIVEGADVGVANPLDIQFTDDPEETLAGNSYFLATGSYVAYSPLDHVIEAHGENGSARLTYRTITLTADRRGKRPTAQRADLRRPYDAQADSYGDPDLLRLAAGPPTEVDRRRAQHLLPTG
jgi:hypothetical protein